MGSDGDDIDRFLGQLTGDNLLKRRSSWARWRTFCNQERRPLVPESAGEADVALARFGATLLRAGLGGTAVNAACGSVGRVWVLGGFCAAPHELPRSSKLRTVVRKMVRPPKPLLREEATQEDIKTAVGFLRSNQTSFRAALLVAFAGLLRCGEFTVASRSQRRTAVASATESRWTEAERRAYEMTGVIPGLDLRVGDVRALDDCLRISLHADKTALSNSTWIVVPSSADPTTCPVRAWREAVRARARRLRPSWRGTPSRGRFGPTTSGQ